MKHDQRLLEEIMQDEPCCGECIAGTLLKYLHIGDDMILQLKMVEKFKYEWSCEADRDVGWEYSTIRFAEEYGKKYRDLWNEGIYNNHVMTMYHALIN